SSGNERNQELPVPLFPLVEKRFTFIVNDAIGQIRVHPGREPCSFKVTGLSFLQSEYELGEADGSGDGVPTAGGLPLVLDNDQPGFVQTGTNWVTDPDGGYGGSRRVTLRESRYGKVSWEVAGLPPGNYTVQATWSSRRRYLIMPRDCASNATYLFHD